MAKEWTDDEVSAEIAKAVQIVREDRLEQFLRTRFKASEENNPPNPPKPDGPTPPPPKSKGDSPEKQPPARKSLWWGETSTESDD